jgi:hypothetical protein
MVNDCDDRGVDCLFFLLKIQHFFRIARSYPCTSDVYSDGIGMLTEANQEKVVEARGLGSLLNLLQSSEDEIII